MCLLCPLMGELLCINADATATATAAAIGKPKSAACIPVQHCICHASYSLCYSTLQLLMHNLCWLLQEDAADIEFPHDPVVMMLTGRTRGCLMQL